MTKIIKSDLTAASSSGTYSALASSISELHDLSKFNESFINESKSKLKGGGYDAVRAKMDVYSDMFQKLSNICQILISNISDANNIMSDFMGEYGELDDSELDELRSTIKNAQDSLSYLNGYTTNSKGQKTRIGSDYQIQTQQNIIDTATKKAKKLEQLKPTDSAAFGMLRSIINDINSMSNAIFGLEDTTFTKEAINARLNNQEWSSGITGENPNLIDIGFYYTEKIDTSKLSSESIAILDQISPYLTEDLPDSVYSELEEALVLADMNIQYSMDNREAKDSNGNPTVMDCSSYVSYVVNKAIDSNIPSYAYTGWYLKAGKQYFDTIDNSSRVPGDLVLANGSTEGHGANHIAIYLGKDESGNNIYSECVPNKGTRVGTNSRLDSESSITLRHK